MKTLSLESENRPEATLLGSWSKKVPRVTGSAQEWMNDERTWRDELRLAFFEVQGDDVLIEVDPNEMFSHQVEVPGRMVKSVEPVDGWTIVHFIVGLGLGITMKRWEYSVGYALGWEFFEWYDGRVEGFLNNALDVVMGVFGAFVGSWFLGVLI